MLLFKIAPHCQHYLGTDFSSNVLQYIEQHLKQQFFSRIGVAFKS
ncbi:hypothetical protein AB0758_48115 [Tolypothrix bouteillei VB521301_2]